MPYTTGIARYHEQHFKTYDRFYSIVTPTTAPPPQKGSPATVHTFNPSVAK